MKKYFFILFYITLITFTGVNAAIIEVPQDYKTIQAGIDAAVPGDTVRVDDGTYTGSGNRVIDFLGKAITVKSKYGCANCIIDCENQSTGFYFHSGETQNSILDGFTIINGLGVEDSEHWYAGGGGGIYCKYSNPIIKNCILRDCTVTGLYFDMGGGISCFRANPLVMNCTISNNIADDFGGGIFLYDCSPEFTQCNVESNEAPRGGGMESLNSGPFIIHCTFAHNQIGPFEETIYGGGLALWSNTAVIDHCQIHHNEIHTLDMYWAYGAGISMAESISDNIISNSIFYGNSISAEQGDTDRAQGGGIACIFGGSATIFNCLVFDNDLDGCLTHGGGIITDFCDTDIINCTVADNSITGPNDVGGVFIHGIGNIVSITNCIVWGNDGINLYDNLGDASITYCDIQGSFTGEGNISSNPHFIVGPLGDYYLSQTDAGQPDQSDCVDAGSDIAANICLNPMDEEICMDQLTTRIDLVTDTGTVDMGYHFPTTTPTSTPTQTQTPTITPDCTSTPTFSPIPTSTPNECDETGITIEMPRHIYHSGDSCWCNAFVCISGDKSLAGYPLFILLDVYGSIFFAPGFSDEIDHYLPQYPQFQPGITAVEVLPDFTWPENAGTASNIHWYGALTNPSISEIHGKLGQFTFGWE